MDWPSPTSQTASAIVSVVMCRGHARRVQAGECADERDGVIAVAPAWGIRARTTISWHLDPAASRRGTKGLSCSHFVP